MYLNLNTHANYLKQIDPIIMYGQVTNVFGLIIEGISPGVQIGAKCEIHPACGSDKIKAEVIGFRENKILMMPLEKPFGITPGSRIKIQNNQDYIGVSNQMLGRVLDGLGKPIDDHNTPIDYETISPIYKSSINPLDRKRINMPLDVGIKAINGLITLGRGQKIGIFAGSGIGKSMLLGMITRHTTADINIIALIGERGREVREFIEKDLSKDALKRSVIVAVTSDNSPLLKLKGAFVATTIAEFFRDQGKNVLLVMDSLTRCAMAQREIGLAIGEPPTSKGYTPSVIDMLSRLLERTGTSNSEGSITGLYTVLIESDDMNDPVADTARSILDGHIVLSRELADKNFYPAIDVLTSVSRIMPDVVGNEHMKYAKKINETIAMYRKIEDMVNIGAYKKGTDPNIENTLKLIEKINLFLSQDFNEKATIDETILQMKQIFNG